MGQLFADERGVWRADEGEPDLGMPWDAIVLVTLHKIHDGRGVVTVLEFDNDAGEVFVATDGISGFDALVAAVSERFETFEASLREAVEADTTLSDPRPIWRRG